MLSENLRKILAAQYFAGKILRTLDLETTLMRIFFEPKSSKNIDFKELSLSGSGMGLAKS